MVAKRQIKKRKTKLSTKESDSEFILKVVIFMLLGSLWVYIFPSDSLRLPFPLGAVIGLVMASHERFKIDRKIEYMVLLLAMFVSFWLPIGFDIHLN